MRIKKGPKYGEKLNSAWQGSIEILRDIFSLFGLELQLAGRNLFSISILALLAILFLLTTWLSFSFIIVAWLVGSGLSILAAVSILMFFNLFLLIISGILIFLCFRNVDFKETRQQIHLLIEDQNE